MTEIVIFPQRVPSALTRHFRHPCHGARMILGRGLRASSLRQVYSLVATTVKCSRARSKLSQESGQIVSQITGQIGKCLKDYALATGIAGDF